MKPTSTPYEKIFAQWLGLFSQKPKYSYRLVDYKNNRHRTDMLLSQTKCHLEILPEGIMVIGEFSENDTTIAVLKNEIESITLVRGKEIIDTFYLSPMHILYKLGVSTSISRYLRIYPSEYKITETRITIKCQDYQLKLITGGNSYEKLLSTFKNCGYINMLNLIEKPSINVLDYTASTWF